MLSDLQHAWRRLVSRPGTSTLAIGMLALAVGLTTGMFTLLDALLFRPAPFRDPGALVRLSVGNDRTRRGVVSPAVLHAWQASGIFQSVEAVTVGMSLLEGGTGLLARPSAVVTPGVFDMLGVRPLVGRLFAADEGRAGADDRVILSEDVWRGAFGRDPDLVGKRIMVDGQSVLVVGIMPASFRFPAWDTVVWMPIDYQARGPARTNSEPTPYARLATAIPEQDALRRAMDVAVQADGSLGGSRGFAAPLAGLVLDAYYERALPFLAGGVVLAFLVLCTNVACLLLAHYSQRRREFGVCAALGASRARLLRQALAENAVLGLAGGAGGVALAWALVALSRGVLPQAFLLRTLNPMSLDFRALAAASIAGLGATVVAGVLPAWIGTRPDSAESLRVVERSDTQSKAAKTTTRVLLISEIAFACTLLAGATLLARSFVNLTRVDRGLETHGVETTWIALPRAQYPDRPARLTATAALEDTVRSIPGVAQVALSFGVPPGSGDIHFSDAWRSDLPNVPPVDMVVESYYVGPDFFTLYGIPILRGRTFQPGDADSEVIVGQRFAERLWPGVDPVGHTFQFDQDMYHVIGLAREIRRPSVDPRDDRPQFYRPFTLGGQYVMMNIRCAGACPDGAIVRQKILAAAPAAVIVRLGPLDDVYDQQLAPPRAAATLTTAFAIVALLAAAGGLFSVLSFAVGLRRREFGVRVALGATPASLRNLVLSDGLGVAAAGFAIGGIAALALGRTLASFEYGITARDPLSWMLVSGVVAITVLSAAWLPARRAMEADPIQLLRHE